MIHKRKEHWKKIPFLPICIILFSMLMLHAFWHFQTSYMKAELDNKQTELEQTAQIKAETVKAKYMDMRRSLEALADNVEGLQRTDKEVVSRELELLSRVGYFSYVGISDTQGNMIDSAGHVGNIQEREYFKSAMAGNVTISDVMTSRLIPEDEIQVISHPIVRDGGITGVVFGILNIKEVEILLENETGNHIYTQIVDSQGNYITRAKTADVLMANENIWDDFSTYRFIESNIDTIREDIENKRSGNFTIQLNKEERVSFYMPLGIGNHYIYSTTSSSYIKDRTSKIGENVILMVMEMFIASGILFWGIYQNNRSMNKQLKESHQETVSSVEMIRIAVQESNQYIFEYNSKTGELRKKVGVENPLFMQDHLENVPDSIIASGAIADASAAAFRDVFTAIRHNASAEETVKVETENTFYWFRLKMKNIYDEERRIVNTVGIVEDITQKKMQEELLEARNQEKRELQKQAERDGLTGLYNAAALKAKVTQVLGNRRKNPGPHLFILMDLDNFKEINDSFGHQYGDQVLVEVASVLQHTFRREDIVARLGGDEFAILLVNASGYEIMEPIFQRLCKKLNKTYEKDGKSVSVSASLGIAISPQQGTDFKELYQKSDLALYQVKKEFKNGFKLYKNDGE